MKSKSLNLSSLLSMSKTQKKEKKIRKKKSSCWLFYTKSDRGGICRLCQKLIVISNNTTTNLLNHLKRKHKIQWEKTNFCFKGKTKDENEKTHLELEKEEDQKEESIELHRSSLEAIRQGKAYQSSDGRTVIWLHPDVQLDLLSTALQPQITLVEHASFDNGEEAMDGATGDKDGTSMLDMDQFIQKEEPMSSDEVVHKADTTDEDYSLVLNDGEMIELGDSTTDNTAQIVTVSSSEDPSTEENPVSSSPSKGLGANLVASNKSKLRLDNMKTSPSKTSLDDIKTNPSNIVMGNLANTTSLLKKTVVVTRCTMKKPIQPKPEWMLIKMGGQTPMSGLVQCKSPISNNISLLKSTCHYGEKINTRNCAERTDTNNTGNCGEQKSAGKCGERNSACKCGERNNACKCGERNDTCICGEENIGKSGKHNRSNRCSSCVKKIKSKNCEAHREDTFDHFGKYIAALLRNMPSKKCATKLQKEMLNFVLNEQMLYED